MFTLKTILAVILLAVFPVWGWREGRRLRLHPDARLRSYVRSIVLEWLFAALAYFLVGGKIFRTPAGDGLARALGPGAGSDSFLYGLLGAMLAVGLIQIVSAWKSPRIRAAVQRQLDPLTFLLPATREEVIWFAVLCVSAGITEEVLYRGFLFHYFAGNPWGQSLGVCLAASAIMFGLGHVYQGSAGMLATSVAGLVLGFLFLSTGHLLLPIVLHTAIDLRSLILARIVTTPSSG
jgi:membrane protease YdiL (CAAX protease family)